MKRVVTYDIVNGDYDDYEDFYEFVDETNAEQITESTYVFDTSLGQKAFEDKIASLFSKYDTVAYITVVDNKLYYKYLEGTKC